MLALRESQWAISIAVVAGLCGCLPHFAVMGQSEPPGTVFDAVTIKPPDPNTVDKSGELDHRFDSWPIPSIVSLADNWVGELPALPVVTEGRGPALASLKLKDAADALLYFGPPGSLETVEMPQSELAGTPYGNEIERRQKLQMALEN